MLKKHIIIILILPMCGSVSFAAAESEAAEIELAGEANVVSPTSIAGYYIAFNRQDSNTAKVVASGQASGRAEYITLNMMITSSTDGVRWTKVLSEEWTEYDVTASYFNKKYTLPDDRRYMLTVEVTVMQNNRKTGTVDSIELR